MVWDVEKAENILMAARAGGQTKMPLDGTKHGQREGWKKGKERRRKGWRGGELAVKIICHMLHDTGIPTPVLISSPSHTSRRERSYFRCWSREQYVQAGSSLLL